MEICNVSNDKNSSEKEPNLKDRDSGPPHESLFLVLAYLPLLELLSIRQVCRSLREAVNNDVLLWLNIIVERPLNLRLTDEILAEISSKADARMQSLALLSCVKISDDGLLWVVKRNPLISKLYIPECTGLSPEGVINAVNTLTEHGQNLKRIKINGIYNLQRKHLETLLSCLDMNQASHEHLHQPTFYHHRNITTLTDMNRSIDVDLCPKCCEVRMVFDCPKKICEFRRERCRACEFCIPRCEECGGCVWVDEVGESVCADALCLSCWFKLPKCNFCNKPYCNRHAYQQFSSADSDGFICDVCQEKFIKISYD